MYRAVFLILSLLMFSSGVRAQTGDYPNRPITFVIPLGAGGSMDIIARAIGPKLTEMLGKPVIVENRTGGGTVIAANAVAKSPPDGYTLLFAPSGTLTTNAALYRSLAYDPVKDFTPVALYVKVPFVLVINNDLPVTSVADLVKLSKQSPLSFGSTGTGAVPHLAGELFKARTGIEMTHVPYKGSQAALSDTMAGHVQLTFADPALAPQLIKEGKVRALGVTSLTRVGVVPDVPPLAEAGVPGFEAVSWHMIMAPAGTPQPIVDKLHAAFKKIFADPELRQKLVLMGLVPVDTPSVPELRAFLANEMKNWSGAVQQAGLAGSE
jgi:tripartite-type tricarboxylate transporter receptor subunit TctC